MSDPIAAGHGPGDQAAAGSAHGAHGGAHGAGDHEEAVLGPVDWVAWGAGLLGVAAGLIIVLCFVLATSAG